MSEAARTLLLAQTACGDASGHAGRGHDAPQPAGGVGVTPRVRARDTIAAAALRAPWAQGAASLGPGRHAELGPSVRAHRRGLRRRHQGSGRKSSTRRARSDRVGHLRPESTWTDQTRCTASSCEVFGPRFNAERPRTSWGCIWGWGETLTPNGWKSCSARGAARVVQRYSGLTCRGHSKYAQV